MNEDASSRGARPLAAGTPVHHAIQIRQTNLVDEEFANFYRMHVKILIAFLIKQNASLNDAADIAQSSMEKLYGRWGEVEYPKAWVYKVASRELIRKLVDARENPVREVPESSSLLPGGGMDEWESRHEAMRVLRMLPPRQRQIMAWTLSDFTPAEIAEQLNLSCEAVRASLRKARQAATALVRKGEEE
ncbi:sigma-70 family RNA polymerase sigma factor [Streptomyces fructofermentans]|uniref:RNA polymerase sigma factor n=1 Tax=Streptomyces fructofermentans TaxID=152141 RepID=UPI00340AC3CE